MASQKSNEKISSIAQHIFSTNHPALAEANITWQVVLVYAKRDKNGEIRSPAIKFNGIKMRYATSITTAMQRQAGAKDMIIKLDGDYIDGLPYNNYSEEYEDKVGELLNNAFYTVELSFVDGKDGQDDDTFDVDDAGRPKLIRRPFSVAILGFEESELDYHEQKVDAGTELYIQYSEISQLMKDVFSRGVE